MPIAWLLDKILTSSHGPLRVDKRLAITNPQNMAYAKVEGYRTRVLEALAWRARSAWPRARPGLGPSQGAPAWFGAVGEPRSGLFAGEAPGPAVLGGPPQAKAPPAHSLMPCVWGVGMSLLCPPGGPTGAHSLIYQANPIGRPARKATADFSKITIIFLGSPCTIFPKVSQTANKSASVVLKHHPVFPPRQEHETRQLPSGAGR
jgi:hypothetical protein